MTAKFVPVHPATLRWAREEIGLSLEQVSDKIKASISEVDQWEQGEKGITLSRARKLAALYKVSLPTLYLKDIPSEWKTDKPEDFRRQEQRDSYSYPLCQAIRVARRRQTWMREFLQEEGEQPLEWLHSFSEQDGITEIAEWVQQWLGADRQEIERLRDDKEAFSYWVRKIESKRVIISANGTHKAYKIDRQEYSGLVLYDEYAPLILLNPADSPARRIFTLLHELAHLLLNDRSGVSQIDFRNDTQGYDPLEVFCNRIAAQCLIDNDLLYEQWRSDEDVSEIISRLAAMLKVSHSAIAVKLSDLNLISDKELNQLLGDYKQRYLMHQKSQSSGGRPLPDKQVISHCGKLLVRSVLTAYEQGSIGATEIYDVLGIRLAYLSKLSERLEFPLRRWIP